MARKPPLLPPMPPPTEEDKALSLQLRKRLEELTAQLHQRNLDNAVLLAQQAARGRGPLVEHFAELGRRYGDTLGFPKKPGLRLVEEA